jgi:hypothetical protein
MKGDLMRDYFAQIESQVQFGDHKASLLLAANSILLAVSGALIKAVATCTLHDIRRDWVTVDLILAVAAAFLLVISLACALWAARPSGRHWAPHREFFLLSYVAGMQRSDFVDWYRELSSDELETEALKTIHGKAAFALKKFLWLRRAVHATLISLLCMVVALMVAVIR